MDLRLLREYSVDGIPFCLLKGCNLVRMPSACVNWYVMLVIECDLCSFMLRVKCVKAVM